MESFQGRVSRAVDPYATDPFGNADSEPRLIERRAADGKPKLHRWQDLFSGKFSVGIAMVLIVAITVSTLILSVRSTNTGGTSFMPLSDQHLASANAALNDLQLASVAIRGLSGGSFNQAEQDRLDFAVVALQQRSEEISSAFVPRENSVDAAMAEFASTALENSAYRASAALSEAARHIDTNLSAFRVEDTTAARRIGESLGRIEQARSSVQAYLSLNIQQRSKQRTFLEARLLWLTVISETLLAVLTVSLIVCLFMLRREGVLRRIRDSALAQVKRQAYFDAVTGLANRVQFTDKVEASLKSGAKGALILFDLDNFKDINDRHGHEIGDFVLKEFARRIHSETVSNNGLAARLGGDEFAIYIETDNLRFLRLFCDAMIQIIEVPMRFDDTTLHVAFSAGLATSTQLSMSQTISMDKLMRVADFALYASKAAGRGRYTLYDSDLEAQFLDRREMVNAMPYAASSGELEVFFQPKFDLVTSETLSFESLVRWRRGDTLLLPGEFIAVAEETGMIVEIDRFVLSRSVELVAAWNRRHRTNFSISVNLSALHFRSASDLSFVSEALEEHQFPPELLTLEITETVQLANWAQVVPAVAKMRDLGVRISIDDFGAGFSSLAYLRMIQANELKIDHTLVREIEDSNQAQFILDAVLELAHHLGLDVVVEGIETENQLRRVREMGCRVGQGYLLSHPVPAEEALIDALGTLKDTSDRAASQA